MNNKNIEEQIVGGRELTNLEKIEIVIDKIVSGAVSVGADKANTGGYYNYDECLKELTKLIQAEKEQYLDEFVGVLKDADRYEMEKVWDIDAFVEQFKKESV